MLRQPKTLPLTLTKIPFELRLHLTFFFLIAFYFENSEETFLHPPLRLFRGVGGTGDIYVSCSSTFAQKHLIFFFSPFDLKKKNGTTVA